MSRMDILTETEIETIVNGSKIAANYNKVIDNQSAYELLTAKLDEAEKRGEEMKQQEKDTRSERKTRTKEKGIFDDPVVRSMTRTAGNTLVRALLGVLGLGGRSRRKSLF